jgi:cytosine/adenosine deaminase-related metal-dependent hydrolase
VIENKLHILSGKIFLKLIAFTDNFIKIDSFILTVFIKDLTVDHGHLNDRIITAVYQVSDDVVFRLHTGLVHVDQDKISLLACIKHIAVFKTHAQSTAARTGLKDSDVLAEGKKADIIMIDMNKPSMQPENSIARNIVYSADNSVVKMTMIDGKILYEDGQYTTIDLDEVFRECNKLMQGLSDI